MAEDKLETALQVVLAKLRAGGRWVLHECSMCGYPCGFDIREGRIYYDNGCDCGVGQHGTFQEEAHVRETLAMNPHHFDCYIAGFDYSQSPPGGWPRFPEREREGK